MVRADAASCGARSDGGVGRRRGTARLGVELVRGDVLPRLVELRGRRVVERDDARHARYELELAGWSRTEPEYVSPV